MSEPIGLGPRLAPRLEERAPEASRSKNLVTAAAIISVLVLAVALRLVPILVVPSLNWRDEVFQTVEPAHRLVYGYGLMAWEFQVGMRSWLLPGAIAGLIEISRTIGEGPEYYLAGIAIGLGLLAGAPVICGYLWCRRRFGLAGAFVAALAIAVAPELVYFGARPLNEVVAAHLLVIALYLVEPGFQFDNRQRLFAAGLVLGLVALLRPQLALAVTLVALWPGPHSWRRRLPAVIGGGLVALAIGATVDWLTLGYPLASVWRNLYYNVHLGVSAGFGVEPWFFYLVGELVVWLGAAPLVVLLAGLGGRRMPLLFWVVLIIVAVHMAVPHKEYRFIYPALVVAMVLAAVGLAEITEWGTQWLAGRGLRPAAAAALCALVVSLGWGAAAANAWSNGGLKLLSQRDHDELLAIAFLREQPGICGVGLYGPEAWVRYGGYAHLHRSVPLFWPKDADALAAAAGAFNTLVTDKPPATAPGFATLRCFGEICVAQRPGGCTPHSAPRVWFPEQLRNSVWEQQRLEPLPDNIHSAPRAHTAAPR